jgi:DNA-binding response OmpR family regulator
MPEQKPGDILVIDDDPAIIQFVVDALEDAGYTARSAQNGEEGLMAILERLPALVLLDLILPGMYGAPLMGQIWAADPRLPIVLMSAMSHRLKPLANQYGIAWIAKPFSVQTLLICVGKYVQPSA